MRTCIGRLTYCLKLNLTMRSGIVVYCLPSESERNLSHFVTLMAILATGSAARYPSRGTRVPVSLGAAWRIRSLTLTLSLACK